MEERSPSIPHWLEIKLGLVFVTGLSLGLAIGVLVANLTFTGAKQAVVKSAPPERWFVWNGDAPLLGDAFGSQADCNNARTKMVDAARAEAEQALRQLPPITYRQIQVLGYVPEDRITAQFEQVTKSYCRRAFE